MHPLPNTILPEAVPKLPGLFHVAPAAAQNTNEPSVSSEQPLVLVVDDEPQIRETIVRILEIHGYRVLSAGDGAEAQRVFALHRSEIRLMISDLSLPKLHGLALARLVRRLNPAVKILIVSGSGPSSTDRIGSGPEGCADALLLKPFEVRSLLQLVHDLLVSTGPGQFVVR
jgi:DNA-binding response OmpR family regulator